MSDRGKRVIWLPAKEHGLLETICMESGLTLEQGVELACLRFFEKHDPNLFRKAKQFVDPAVLREFETPTQAKN